MAVDGSATVHAGFSLAESRSPTLAPFDGFFGLAWTLVDADINVVAYQTLDDETLASVDDTIWFDRRPNSTRSPTLAAGPGIWGLAWEDSGYRSIRFSSNLPGGSWSPPWALTEPAEGSEDVLPTIVWMEGETFWLVWTRLNTRDTRIRRTMVTRFWSEGGTEEPAEVTWPQISYASAAAWSGRILGVVWVDDEREFGPGVYFSTVRPGAAGFEVGEERFVGSLDESEQPITAPQILWTGSEFVVAWGTSGVHLATVAEDGDMLFVDDGLVAPTPFSRTLPRIAWTGSVLAVVWRADSRNIVLKQYRICDPGSE